MLQPGVLLQEIEEYKQSARNKPTYSLVFSGPHGIYMQQTLNKHLLSEQIISKPTLEKSAGWTRGRAHQFRALAALPENQHSVPSTHTAAHDRL